VYQAAPQIVYPAAPQPAAPAAPRPSTRGVAVTPPSARMAPAPQAVPAGGNRVSARRAAPVSAAESGRPAGVNIGRRAAYVGKPLLLCFAILGVMAVTAGVLYVIRSRQTRDIKRIQTEEQEIFERNMALGFDKYRTARNAGLLFVMGKDKAEGQALEDKLFGPFRNDDKVYNVIYDRNFKDRRNLQQTEQKAMFRDRLRVDSIEHGKEDSGVRVIYGFAENKTVTIVISREPIKAETGDNANLGGMITVIAKAESDKFFDKAKQPKVVPEKKE